MSGILTALDRKPAFGEVINLGSGQPRTIRSVIDEVVRRSGRGNPLYGARPYRQGENMELYPDVTRAQSLLTWSPGVEFGEGLQQTIEYYRGRTH